MPYCRWTVQSYSPGGATCRIQLNFCFLQSTRVHNPNSKLSRFRTTHGRKSLYFTMGALSPKTAVSYGRSGPHLIQFLGPIQAHNPNGTSISSAVFAQTTAVSIYLTMGRPLPPQNCPLSWGNMDPHLIHGS